MVDLASSFSLCSPGRVWQDPTCFACFDAWKMENLCCKNMQNITRFHQEWRSDHTSGDELLDFIRSSRQTDFVCVFETSNRLSSGSNSMAFFFEYPLWESTPHVFLFLKSHRILNQLNFYNHLNLLLPGSPTTYFPREKTQIIYQWPFQKPQLEVPTIYKAYFSTLYKGVYP